MPFIFAARKPFLFFEKTQLSGKTYSVFKVSGEIVFADILFVFILVLLFLNGNADSDGFECLGLNLILLIEFALLLYKLRIGTVFDDFAVLEYRKIVGISQG